METNSFLDLDNLEVTDRDVLAEARAEAIKSGEEKKARVLKHMEANPHFTMREVAEKFGLDWVIEKDFVNGLGRIGFYADQSQTVLVCEIRDDLSKWFR